MKNPFLDDLLLIRRQTLDALRALDGTLWHQASGELHYQYKEMPNWIVLGSSQDIRTAHRAFVAIFEPYFTRLRDVNVTVSYTIGNTKFEVLDTNEIVRSALDDPDFGRAAP